MEKNDKKYIPKNVTKKLKLSLFINARINYKCKHCNDYFYCFAKMINQMIDRIVDKPGDDLADKIANDLSPSMEDKCQNCGANPEGKLSATPKREAPRVIKEYSFEENPTIDYFLEKLINDNTKAVDDIKNKKLKAIGQLVGLSKKEFPTVSGGELNARLNKLLKDKGILPSES